MLAAAGAGGLPAAEVEEPPVVGVARLEEDEGSLRMPVTAPSYCRLAAVCWMADRSCWCRRLISESH